MSDLYFNIANINLSTTAEGPYNRMAIWFQGCDINCHNCCNPHLQAFVMKNLLSIDELMEYTLLAKNKFDIEGISLTGGEPTMQLKSLIQYVKQVRKLDLGIILFTGRLMKDIPGELKNNLDLIIDGRYIEKLTDNERMFVGSTNQKLNFMTNRYNMDLFQQKNKKIVNISGNIINGDPLFP